MNLSVRMVSKQQGEHQLGAMLLMGVISGYDKCQGYVTFLFSASTPTFTVNSFDADTGFGGSIEVKPGADVNLLVTTENVNGPGVSNASYVAQASPGLTLDASSVTISRVTAGKSSMAGSRPAAAGF